MSSLVDLFERVAREAYRFHEGRRKEEEEEEHPFDGRNIHPDLPPEARQLFDNGHYAQATFEAFKFIDAEVRRHSKLSKTGEKLMMEVFKEAGPKIQLTPLKTVSQKDEQRGYKFLFAGGMIAIRNPRGHDPSVPDDIDVCLDHLSFVSMLLRRLATAGFRTKRRS